MSSLSYLYFRDRKTFDFPLPKWCLKFYFSLTLIVLSSPVTLFTLSYCLGFLFIIVFTFPFLVTKYWLGHSWMYFRLSFSVDHFVEKKSLVRQCEYTTQPQGSFWCHVIDAKGAVFYWYLCVLVLHLSFSFRYLVELKLL